MKYVNLGVSGAIWFNGLYIAAGLVTIYGAITCVNPCSLRQGAENIDVGCIHPVGMIPRTLFGD
jgi:hypothetical protein